jgi:valyl-tRNA synthetase
MRIGPARVESNRNFSTKLWNAARFCEINGCRTIDAFDPGRVDLTVNKWIVAETAAAVHNVTRALEELRFNEAASVAYQFVWSRFCDWYLELIKPLLSGGNETHAAETRAAAAWVRDQILRLLHPFMPFITEELWAQTAARDALLIVSNWPDIATPPDENARAEIDWLIALISGVRSVRTEMNVPAATRIELVLTGADETARERLTRNHDAVTTLARLSHISFVESVPSGSAQFVVGEIVAALPLGDVIDLAKERARLEKELQRAQAEIGKIDAKLNNVDFMARAPDDVVEEQRERRAEADGLAHRLREAVRRLA